MPAFTYNFTIEQGTSFRKPFVYKDSLGIPIDLSGFTARMQMRPSKSSSLVLLDLTTENGGIVIEGPKGAVTMVFTEAMTSALSRSGVYDLELVNGSTVMRFVEGEITLSKEVTRHAG